MAFLVNDELLKFNAIRFTLRSNFYLEFERIPNEPDLIYSRNTLPYKAEKIHKDDLFRVIKDLSKINPMEVFNKMEYYTGILPAIRANRMLGFKNLNVQLIWVPLSTLEKCKEVYKINDIQWYSNFRNGMFVDKNCRCSKNISTLIDKYNLYYKIIEDDNIYSTAQMSE